MVHGRGEKRWDNCNSIINKTYKNSVSVNSILGVSQINYNSFICSFASKRLWEVLKINAALRELALRLTPVRGSLHGIFSGTRHEEFIELMFGFQNAILMAFAVNLQHILVFALNFQKTLQYS